MSEIQTRQGKVWVEKIVTPERAAELLRKLHPGQRAVRPDHVNMIAKSLRDGNYVWTSDPIKLDAHDQVIDGQHRLSACVQARVSLLDVVFSAVYDSNAIKHIDTCVAPRNIRDIRRVAGEKPIHNALVAAIVLEFCDFKQSDARLLSKVDRSELASACALLPEITALYSSGGPLGVTSPSIAAALRCMSKHPRDAFNFFKAAFTNSPLVDGKLCPQARLLSDYLIAQQQRRHRSGPQGRDQRAADETEVIIYKLIRVFNAWRAGENMNHLQAPRAKSAGEIEIPAVSA